MSNHTVAIHQPNYLPWLGYFHKIQQSDVFVFLDDVEYTSGSWIIRNKIKTPDGWTWLTVPVTTSSGEIRDIKIADHTGWRDEHWKSLKHNYGGAAYFEQWAGLLKDTYNTEWESLYKLNRHLLQIICDELGLKCEFVESSSLSVQHTKTERLVEICDAVDADTYFSGQGADGYTDEQLFRTADIDLEYQSFEHPCYQQRFDDFIPSLSFVDLLFNVGTDEATEILRSL